MPDLVFRSPHGILAGVLLLTILAAVLAWRVHRPLTGWSLTALLSKLGALAVIGFLLLNPEIRKVIPPMLSPTLMVLVDQSPSMQTSDMDGQTRTKVVEEFELGQPWQEFLSTTELQVNRRSFGVGAQATDLSGALESIGEPQAVLLLSDGSWNTGAPPSLQGQLLRQKGIPVYSVVMGADQALPDLALTLDEAPAMVETDEPFQMSLKVSSTFLDEVSTLVTLSKDGEVISTQELVLPSKQIVPVSFQHEVSEEGDHTYQLSLEPIAGETLLSNNTLEHTVVARQQKVKVLLVDTLPRWEYRFIRNAMMRDPLVEVSCVLLHPELPAGQGGTYLPSFPTKSELAQYDVIFLGDIGIGEGQLSKENTESIVESVRNHASGLILMPGRQGWQESLYSQPSFQALYPVVLADEFNALPQDHASRLALSSLGADSLLLSLSSDVEQNKLIWEHLPGFTWSQPATQVKAGALALAYHPTERSEQGRLPIIVTGTAGRGKVLYMGIDSSWKWRRGVEDVYHYRFWRQMARWMSYQRNLTDGSQAQLFLSNETPTEGDHVVFDLHAVTLDGEPATVDNLRFVVADGEDERLVSLQASDQWGEFSGSFKIENAGDHQLQIYLGDEQIAQRRLTVTPRHLETVNEPADAQTLSELAQLTQGVSVTYPNRYEIISHLHQAAELAPKYEFSPLNQQALWYLITLGLLILSWLSRRRSPQRL